ncbi:hypothetical protein AB0I53_08750 [Saccharopolyspora sp. NPDC050389]|uniref:hypothetical protein n=1 Tax=Saccharopolyspora sp. NPDC050389 TaxID=3155516 RepID=UPI0033CEB0DD
MLVGSCRVVAPVFTDEELEGLRRFPEIGREDLFRFFALVPADVAIRAPSCSSARRDHRKSWSPSCASDLSPVAT